MSDKRPEQSFQALATGLPQLVFACRGTGERTWPSPQWIVYTGFTADESLGFGWLEAVHPDDRRATLAAWADAAVSGEFTVEHRIWQASADRHRWHLTRAVPLVAPYNSSFDWVGSSTDVHKARQSGDELAEAERRLRTLVEGMPQLLWRSCDMGNWTWASPQWCKFTGQTLDEPLGHGWLQAVHPDDRSVAMAAWAEARPHGQLDVEFRVYRVADGAYLWHRTRSAPVRDGTGEIVEWLGTTTDVQDLKALQERQQILVADLKHHAKELEGEVKGRELVEARLLHNAQHDGLTGLYNRTYLNDCLRSVLNKRSRGRCAVLFLDLDRFKMVNDSLGHRAGDILLVEAAARFRSCIFMNHTLARFGGDEFVVLVEDIDLATVVALAGTICNVMQQPLWIEHQEVFPACSIGLVMTNDEHKQPGDVLRDADIAMYHAKHYSKGGYAVLTDAMRDSAVEALNLRTDLRNAVARGEFVLHYQPIYGTVTGNIVGLETLIRWEHPQRGLVFPASFIGVAEETGLIRDIGRWVLQSACTQMQSWRERFPGLNIYLNVNTSGEELQDSNFPSIVLEVLRATHLHPGSLQIEVTESVLLRDPDRIGGILGGLRERGIRVALDDFGTGYSSLSYLDRFQFDTLKIDRSFVLGLTTRPKAVAIIRAVVQLGQAIELDVVAEGVENDEQLRALRDVGCAAAQGYFLGRPSPASDITALLMAVSDSNSVSP